MGHDGVIQTGPSMLCSNTMKSWWEHFMSQVIVKDLWAVSDLLVNLRFAVFFPMSFLETSAIKADY